MTSHWPSCSDPTRTACDRDVIVVLDDEHLAATAAVALDRLLRHRDGIGIDALLDQHANIHARQQFTLRIRKFAAQRHLPGMGVDLGLGKQQLAGDRIDRAVIEHQSHLQGIGRDAIEVAAFKRLAQAVEFGDRLGEIGIDRIELLHRRKARGLVLHDQRAFAGQRSADHAIDRRADRRIIEIEPGAGDVRLASFDVGFRLALRRNGFFVLGFGGGLLAGERGDAAGVLRSLVEHSLCLGQRRLVGLHFDFKGTRIDLVKPIAGLDLAALTERPLDHDAGDARPHVGDARRRDASGQFAHHRARLRLDGDDADIAIGRLCRGGRGVRFVAARKQRGHGSDNKCNACRLRAKS